MITTIKLFKESIKHNDKLYRNTTQQWLINLLTNGKIKTEDKDWISLSQDPMSGGSDFYDNCHIIFNGKMIYNQGGIEIDYQDPSFFEYNSSIAKHVTGFRSAEEYYDNNGYSGPEEANENFDLTWEDQCKSYSNEQEVVIEEIIYQPGLILNVEIMNHDIKKDHEFIEPILENLLIKYKINYKRI